MAKISKTKVIKDGLEFMTIKKFIDKYHEGLTVPSINYAIDNNKVDYMQPGRERFIVLTTNTLKYQPINHPKRSRMSLDQ